MYERDEKLESAYLSVGGMKKEAEKRTRQKTSISRGGGARGDEEVGKKP